MCGDSISQDLIENVPYFLFIYFFFSGPHLQHMEVPRLGVKSELQLPAYSTAIAMPDQAAFATHTAVHSKAKSLTH